MKKEIRKLLVTEGKAYKGLNKLLKNEDYEEFIQVLKESINIDSVTVSGTQNDFGLPDFKVKIDKCSQPKFEKLGNCLAISVKSNETVVKASEFMFDNNITIKKNYIGFDYSKIRFYYSVKDSFLRESVFSEEELLANEIVQSNPDDEDLAILVYGQFDENEVRARWGNYELTDYDNNIRYTRGLKTVNDILDYLTEEDRTPKKFYLDKSERYDYGTVRYNGDVRECIMPSETTYFNLRYRFKTVLGHFYIEVGNFSEG